VSATKPILLVDDDEFVLACVQRMIERRFHADVAVGGKQALDVIAARGPFAVILTDMRMPGMNGIQLLSRARQSAPHTVGLLLSGDTYTDEIDDATGKGIVFRLIEKPCSPETLIQSIEEALARHDRLIQVPV
jgi:DNA-binding NtrC family response regulator